MNWNEKRYHSLDYECKRIFGQKTYRLSIDAGFSCPNRDGTISSGGCIFCGEKGSGEFAVGSSSKNESVKAQLLSAKQVVQSKTRCEAFIAYFQAYTNTYAPLDTLKEVFTEAINEPYIVALSIATRPDCLDDSVLNLLSQLNQIKPVWIELGLQTIHERTASFINRGYPLSTYQEAICNLKKINISVITHLILGLPGETISDMLSSVDYVGKTGTQGIKLHMLYLQKGTALADYYKSQPFSFFTMNDYCNLIVHCLEILPPEMVIHRITGDGDKSLLLAPLWSADKKKVLNLIQKKLKNQDTWQGKNYVR